jgi:hypothetical protein
MTEKRSKSSNLVRFMVITAIIPDGIRCSYNFQTLSLAMTTRPKICIFNRNVYFIFVLIFDGLSSLYN